MKDNDFYSETRNAISTDHARQPRSKQVWPILAARRPNCRYEIRSYSALQQLANLRAEAVEFAPAFIKNMFASQQPQRQPEAQPRAERAARPSGSRMDYSDVLEMARNSKYARGRRPYLELGYAGRLRGNSARVARAGSKICSAPILKASRRPSERQERESQREAAISTRPQPRMCSRNISAYDIRFAPFDPSRLVEQRDGGPVLRPNTRPR